MICYLVKETFTDVINLKSLKWTETILDYVIRCIVIARILTKGTQASQSWGRRCDNRNTGGIETQVGQPQAKDCRKPLKVRDGNRQIAL